MSARPEWLEKFRVRNLYRNERNKKAVYINRENSVVLPTHFNLEGGTYSVPRDYEMEFLQEYGRFVFGDTKGTLALTENALSSNGIAYSPVFIDFDLRYPLTSDGR